MDKPAASTRVSRRCEMGCESWPDDKKEYGVCPRCGEKTKRYSNMTPLSEDEARSIKNHILFEEWCEAHGRL